MIKITAPLIRVAMLTALVGSFAMTAQAQTPPDTDATPPAASGDMQSGAQSGGKWDKGEMHVEKRIKTLHDKLMITPAEENDWNTVAQTMRDNEATISQLIRARHQNPESMTAVEDLQSYQKIAQAHADGLQKMTSAFQTLYNDMSDAQKKNADEVFGTFEGHGGKHHMKHKS